MSSRGFKMSPKHDKDCKMHKAISLISLDKINRLLAAGDSLCTSKGKNCFVLAASSPYIHGKRLEMLKKMLEINPNGANAESESGITLLMMLCYRNHDDSLNLIYNLINMGANVNAADNKGRTALIRLFEATQFSNYFNIWPELLSAGANPTQGKLIQKVVKYICEKAYVKGHEEEVNESCWEWRCAEVILLMTNGDWPYKKLMPNLVHPLFYFIDCAVACPKFLPVCITFVRKASQADLMLSPLVIPTAEVIKVWPRSLTHLDVPCLPYMGPIGYLLYKVFIGNLEAMLDVFIDPLKRCLSEFLVWDLETKAKDVLNPLLLVFCSLDRSCSFSSSSTSEFVSYCFSKLQDKFPLPHKLIEGRYLSLLKMMKTHITDDCDDTFIDLVFTIMKLCPEHPYYTFAILRDCFSEQEIFMERLANRILPYVGSLSVSGVEKRALQIITNFVQEDYPNQDQVKMFINNCRNKPASLKMLSVWKLRKYLFDIRPDHLSSLPAMVEGLCQQGYLPRCLKADLLLDTIQENWSA